MELLKRISLGVFVIAIVLLAVIMGGLRLAIMNIDFFKPEIEYLLERDLASGFVFTGLSGDLNRFNPILRIENVSITLPDRSQPLFIDSLEVEIDFWASWRENTLVVLEVTGQLEKLELVKDKAGNWSTNDLSLSIDPDSGPAPEFRQVLALVPRYLNLNLSRLIIRDQQTETTHQLDRIHAHINHLQDQFFVKISAALPEQLGRGILVKATIDPERSLVYLNSSSLKLAPVAALFDLDAWGLQQGALDGEVWINMSRYQVLAVNGELTLKNGMVQMSPDKLPLAVSYRSRFSAINLKTRWRVANKFQRLSIDNRAVVGFNVQLEVADGPGNKIISAWIDHLPLSNVPVVAGQWLPARLSEQIAQGKFEGSLQDVLLSIDLESPEDFYLGGRAVGVNTQTFDNYPGASNINADFQLGRGQLGARIYGQDVSLDFGNHFEAPIKLDRLEAQAIAKRFDGELLLSVSDLRISNQDLKATGRMWLETDQDQRPFTFIRASFSDADGSSTSKYLPRNHLPLKTQAWLDRGIKQGYVSTGEMQFHGRLSDIRALNREMAGEFFVDFSIDRAEVFFAPGWQPARNGSGRILFHNVSMNIDLDRVSYDQVDNARARVTIADLENPSLDLRIETDSSTALAVSTWLDTPVGKRYRPAMSNLDDFDGTVATEVNLSMPLQGPDLEPDVLVLVNFNNAGARSESWGIDLSQANGEMEVTADGIRARQITARFFDDPIEIDIDTPGSGTDTRVSARGLIETRQLLNKLPSSLTRDLSGRSDWRIRLDIAGVSTPRDKPLMRLNATSNLRDTEIRVPKPLTKPAPDLLQVTADVDFFEEQIWFNSRVGDMIRTRGQLVPDKERNFTLNLLDVAFASELKPKTRKGLHLYGSIAEVSIDDWLQYFKDSSVTEPGQLDSVELEFDRVTAFKRDLSNVSIELERDGERFLGKLDASKIRGNFVAPQRPSASNPVIVDLEYLRIDKLEEGAEEAELRPSELVDFRLRSDALLFHEILFNDLQLEARVDGDKLQVDKLGMRKDNLILTGMAYWDYDAASKSHLSSVTLSVKGDKMGQALAGMGFGNTMTDGSLDFSGGFTWPAPLTSLTVETLVGDAKFRIEDGILNNVEPGTGGKFVGLLSLSALPRRLSLDFSDMLIEGMGFDKIDGSYRIDNGILYTRNTRLEGVAAKIKISGQTDIARREYDQTIVVTPKIRQTLPLIGAVSVGATVGWGLLLLQNLFKKAIDEAVEIEYQITGSWDDPQIELIKAVDENQRELPQIDR